MGRQQAVETPSKARWGILPSASQLGSLSYNSSCPSRFQSLLLHLTLALEREWLFPHCHQHCCNCSISHWFSIAPPFPVPCSLS